MNLDIETFTKFVSPIITLILGAFIKHYSERRAKVLSYIGHVSSFHLKTEEPSWVYTHSVIIRNAGRKEAKNIRLGHNILPTNFTIYPSIQYTIETNREGASEIVIPILVPKEQVTISYLYFPPLTWEKINAYAKYDEGLAKVINVIPIPQPSRWVILLVWTLMFFGASILIYWLLNFIVYVL